VTYKGDRPIIRNKTAIVITDIALINANLIIFSMLNRVCQILSIISFLMVASMTATGVIGYRYVTSEQFKSRVLSQIIKEVQTILPAQINNKLPTTTGQAIPKKLKLLE